MFPVCHQGKTGHPVVIACIVHQSLETMHSSYTPEMVSLAEKIATEFNLLSSGGSDFHGSIKPDISLGTGKGWLCIPSKIYSNLLAVWKCRYRRPLHEEGTTTESVVEPSITDKE